MLRLKNIVRNDKQISADYYPENSDEKGYICVDIQTGNVLCCKKSTFDQNLGSYSYHAAQALRNLLPLIQIPSERLVMWY